MDDILHKNWIEHILKSQTNILYFVNCCVRHRFIFLFIRQNVEEDTSVDWVSKSLKR